MGKIENGVISEATRKGKEKNLEKKLKSSENPMPDNQYRRKKS